MAGAVYRLGVALHDLEDPSIIKGVADQWILQPEDPWEITGYVSNVVFTCGAVEEDDGTVKIAATSGEQAEDAINRIKSLTAEVEVGTIYSGKVVRLADFGAFVNILPGKDGLVHISQITEERVQDVNEHLKEGQEIRVKVMEIDRQGRIKLTMKQSELEATTTTETSAE